MTDKARELLERALKVLDLFDDCAEGMKEEIRAYLAEPEMKREQFSDDAVADSYSQLQPILGEYLKFKAGFRMAEKMHVIGDKHHGIGSKDE